MADYPTLRLWLSNLLTGVKGDTRSSQTPPEGEIPPEEPSCGYGKNFTYEDSLEALAAPILLLYILEEDGKSQCV